MKSFKVVNYVIDNMNFKNVYLHGTVQIQEKSTIIHR